MKTAKEIAQWVIDNRYPKSENEKVTDVEMYYELVESIEKLCDKVTVIKSFCDCDKWHDRMEESNNTCSTCGNPIK